MISNSLPEIRKHKKKKEKSRKQLPELIEKQSFATASEEKVALLGSSSFKDLAVLVSASNAKALRRFSGCAGSSELWHKIRFEAPQEVPGKAYLESRTKERRPFVVPLQKHYPRA